MSTAVDVVVTHSTSLSPLVNRNVIYKDLRQTAAMASGLEALAVRALEVGETTEQDLENIADLSSALKEKLNELSTVLNDLTGQ